MSARIAQQPPADYRPSSTTDLMATCDECSCEWGWGASWGRLKQLVVSHNAELHAGDTPTQEGDQC